MSHRTRFDRSSSKQPSDRLDRVEDYLVRNDGWSDGISGEVSDLQRRVSELETWKISVLVFIGATKVRWGVVSFVTAIVAAIITAGLIKALNL